MQRGNEEAYQEFMQAYHSRLFRYLLVLMNGQEAAAKDVLQATLMRVVRHVRLFESEPVFWSWLCALARSAAIDEKRKHLRHDGFLQRFFRSRPVEEITLPPEEALTGLLADQLSCLEPEERELIEMKYVAGESVSDMAQRLGVSEKAVESRLTRARARLRTLLTEAMNHE